MTCRCRWSGHVRELLAHPDVLELDATLPSALSNMWSKVPPKLPAAAALTNDVLAMPTG